MAGGADSNEADRLSRRQVLSLGACGLVVLCAGCSSAGREKDPAALDPPLEGQFGTVVDAGDASTITATLRQQPFVYVPEARTYVVAYPEALVTRAKSVYPTPLHPGLDARLLALFQSCTHLGCRVPFCSTSEMFECPCHSGVFSRYGEWRSGPPPRGMDMFPLELKHGRVLIDTAHVVRGRATTTDVSGQTPAGPTCI